MITGSFIDNYLATGSLEKEERLIQISSGQPTDRSAVGAVTSNPFEYGSDKNKMNQLHLIN